VAEQIGFRFRRSPQALARKVGSFVDRTVLISVAWTSQNLRQLALGDPAESTQQSIPHKGWQTAEVIRTQSLLNDPVGADPIGRPYLAECDAIVRADHGKLILSLRFLHRALGNQQSILVDTSRRSNPGVLARTQDISRIRENTPDPEGFS
jgi:hypothetical protein